MSSNSRILLIGFSGTGKTTVGRLAARELGWEFVDTDDLIVERAGKSIERIFDEEGEESFRHHEQQAIVESCSKTNVVIALGGGAVTYKDNLERVKAAGFVIALEANPEIIHQRLFGSFSQTGENIRKPIRPLLEMGGEEPLTRIKRLKSERQPAYSTANWIISTDLLTIYECATEIIRSWNRANQLNVAQNDSQVAALVKTASATYPIVVGWGILEEQLGRRLIENGFKGRAFIVCDANVFHPYGRYAQRSLHQAGIDFQLFSVPPGETSKSLSICSTIFEWLASHHAERRDAIIALGGGVCGDLGGFVAATYLRGIQLVQVPTTLLAMVDASIGGKVAVDLPAAKNLVGAFHHPSLVLADVSALSTLPDRVVREGWAEAVKHGLVFDADLVAVYESNSSQLLSLEPELTTRVIAWNAAIKARVVSEDEKETKGIRTLLNYGHTIGHAIESAAGYGKYLHGEAVAIGMNGAALLGERLGVTTREVVDRQSDILRMFHLPNRYEGIEVDSLIGAMALDKKTNAGQISWVFLDQIGAASIHRNVNQGNVREVLTELAV